MKLDMNSLLKQIQFKASNEVESEVRNEVRKKGEFRGWSKEL